MPRALSLDLRERVIAAIAAGASCRQAAERFGVGPAATMRWQARFRTEGHIAAKPMGAEAGACLLYLPPYSPDFNPIENVFAKLKPCSGRRRHEPSRTCMLPSGRPSRFTSDECRNCLAAAGYDACDPS